MNTLIFVTTQTCVCTLLSVVKSLTVKKNFDHLSIYSSENDRDYLDILSFLEKKKGAQENVDNILSYIEKECEHLKSKHYG